MYALWRIKQHAKRLGLKKNEPIAKYLSTKGKSIFITDLDIKTILQHIARKKLKVHPSNLNNINKHTQNMKIFHVPGQDDILWENNFYATKTA